MNTAPSALDDEARALVGAWTDDITCCDPVEAGAVRRYAQAIMDDDPDYAAGARTRFGGAIAPPLYPNHMLRRPYGAPDVVQERAHDADFDGVVPQPALPPIRCLSSWSTVNGGSEFEFFRHALHGESVTMRQRYAQLRETSSGKGPLVVVVIEGEMRTAGGELLLRTRRTLLRRPT